MTFRIAVVQPILHPPGGGERNVRRGVRALDRRAAKQRLLGPQWQRLHDLFYPQPLREAAE
ncbi:MAG: hypothetical protein ACRECV_06795 [Xanthobacteraceae bacterium]